MKSGELVLGVEYGVIPAWDYSSADKKNPLKTTRKSVAKASLVNLTKYNYQVYRSYDADDSKFIPAPKGQRSVGYLVVSYDWTDTNSPQPIYWLARAQDIVAPYADLEKRWLVAEAEEKLREEQYRKDREAKEQREREVVAVQTRLADACVTSLRSILGAERTTKITYDIVNKRVNAEGDWERKAYFELDTHTLQLLIEKVLEARDSVN